RDPVTGALAPGQPPREQRALAHTRPAGDEDPAIGAIGDQQLIEPIEEIVTADESLVALPLDSVVEALPGHPRGASYRGGGCSGSVLDAGAKLLVIDQRDGAAIDAIAARRAARVPPQLELAEPRPERIVDQEAPGEGVPEPEQQLDRLGRLEDA